MHQRTVFIIEDNKTEAMVMKLAISGFKNLSVEHFENGKDCANVVKFEKFVKK